MLSQCLQETQIEWFDVRQSYTFWLSFIITMKYLKGHRESMSPALLVEVSASFYTQMST